MPILSTKQVRRNFADTEPLGRSGSTKHLRFLIETLKSQWGKRQLVSLLVEVPHGHSLTFEFIAI